VKKVKLNGETITDYKITHQQIMAGGTLDFQMK
jgi:putative alpha-1,2-mannosidase